MVLVRAVEVTRMAMKRVEFRAFRLLKHCRISPVEEWFATTASVASRKLNEAAEQVRSESPYLMDLDYWRERDRKRLAGKWTRE